MKILKSERGIIYVYNGLTCVKQLDEMTLEEFRLRWKTEDPYHAYRIACNLNVSGRWGTVRVFDDISEEDAGFRLTEEGFERLAREIYSRNEIED